MSTDLHGASRRDPIVSGIRFALRRAEPPDSSASGDAQTGTPVLLLHGVPETSLMWRDLLPALAGDRTVLAPDLKGFGDSEAHGPYDVGTLVRELAELVRAEVAGPIDVVGHDWGGTLGAVLAARYPDLVRRLVVMNAPYRRVDYLHAWHMVLFSLPALPKALLQLGGRRAVDLMLRAGWYAETPLDDEVKERYIAAYSSPERLDAMLSYYRTATRPRLLRTLRRVAEPVLPVRGDGSRDTTEESQPLEPRVPAQPTLVVWGARDPVLPLSVGESTVRDLGPQTEMVTVPGAGHFVLEEAPETVVPAVLSFLNTPD